MTRKDYELIADVIKRIASYADGNGDGDDAYYGDGNYIQSGVRRILMMHLTPELSRDDANFDEAEFLKACGIK